MLRKHFIILTTILLIGAGCSSKKAVAPQAERHFFDLDKYITEQQKTLVSISPATTTDVFAGTLFKQEFTATGIDKKTGQWVISKGELPSGLTLRIATEKNKAIISGITTTTPDSYTFEITAFDEKHEGSAFYTMAVHSPLTVTTDKSTYALNEPIQISVTVYNGETSNLTLLPCPIHYTIEPLLDEVESYQTHLECKIQESKPIVIEPNQSRTWTITHNHNLFGSSPGTHSVKVDIDAEGDKNLSASTTIIISP